MLFLQETRGTEADLTQFPQGHEYFGTFAEVDVDAATSRRGGVVTGIRTEVCRAAHRIVSEVIARGRILQVSLLLDRWIHRINIHIDPALPLSVRRKSVRKTEDEATLCQDIVVMGGDWNFVAGGDSRERLEDSQHKEDENMNGMFDDLFCGFSEAVQQEMTFRRLPRAVGGAAIFSRTDRLYTNLHYTTLSQYAVTTGVRGRFMDADAPSDHRAVVLSMRPRRISSAPWLDGHVCTADAFTGILEEELSSLDVPTCPEAYVEMLRNAILQITPEVRLSMLSSPTVRNSALAEVCLRAPRSGARGRWDLALKQLAQYTCFHDMASRPHCEIPAALQLRLRTHIDANIVQELREIEKSAMPDQHKSAKRARVRQRREHIRLRRRRHVLEGIHDEAGEVSLDPTEAGRAVASHWQPVFAESVMDDELMQEFLDYVQLSPVSQWVWPRAEWISTMAGVTDTTPGPTGSHTPHGGTHRELGQAISTTWPRRRRWVFRFHVGCLTARRYSFQKVNTRRTRRK